MIAYSHKSLDNLEIHDEATSAMRDHLLSKEEVRVIKEKYPVTFYTPNLFIRIGLFLLTVLITFMSLGLFALLGNTSNGSDLGGLLLFFSLATYAGLEYFIRQKDHYRSGIDDALLWMSMGFLFASINILFNFPSGLSVSIFVFILSSYSLLRFGNALMGGIAFASVPAIIFYSLLPLGTLAQTILPFILMAICFAGNWITRKTVNYTSLRHYKHCIVFMQVLSLIGFYAAGNYFIVQELSNELFGYKEGRSIPGAWIFWLLTILVPLAYIFRGLQKRDVILLRSGLALIAAAVFTIHYYYTLATADVVMTIAGILMISIAYFITKLLTPHKYGFTHATPNDPKLSGLSQLESLAIAQTFHGTGSQQNDQFDFGGGNTGGGGASENY